MKPLIIHAIILLFISGCATFKGIYSKGRANGDKEELERIGLYITDNAPKWRIDWDYVIERCGRFCNEGSYHFNKTGEAEHIDGNSLKQYVLSLKKIDLAQRKCLRFKYGTITIFQSITSQAYTEAIKCLQKIDLSFKKPEGINFFYFDPHKVFGKSAIESLIADLREREKKYDNRLLQEEIDRKYASSNGDSKYGHQNIPSSQELVSSSSKYIGKTFYLFAAGKYYVGLNQKSDRFAFNYFVYDDEAGSGAGEGNYFIVCHHKATKGCDEILNIFSASQANREISGTELILKFEKITTGINKFGQQLTLPFLKVVKVPGY